MAVLLIRVQSHLLFPLNWILSLAQCENDATSNWISCKNEDDFDIFLSKYKIRVEFKFLCRD